VTAVRVGVLAIQGAFDKHCQTLEALGAETRHVLTPRDLEGLDGLILPGGESTTIAKGLDREGLYAPLAEFAASGAPCLGTCAGAILMARRTENHPVRTLGLLDAVAQRNAYGTQVDSFSACPDPDSAREFEGLRCVFIRAPQLSELGPGVEVLIRVDGRPVLIRQGAILASTFHPELAGDDRVHASLLDAIAARTPAARNASSQRA
jgi:5'-phosphate synthase pdxT subunit